MEKTGRGALAVWVDAAPEAEADFNDWYNRQHVPERVGIPGFLAGARYEAATGDPKYLAWYETEDVEVLRSAAYLDRLNNPTPWTRRIMPSFRQTVRAVFEVKRRAGRGRGGVAATIRFAPSMAPEGEGSRWLEREAIPGVLAGSGIVGAQLWQSSGGAPAETAETGLRGADSSCAAAVLLEATDTEAAERACREWFSPARLGDVGLNDAPQIGVYRLLFALERR